VKLNPGDIQHQEFKRVMRGFDPDEVTAFLEVVAENYKEILDETKLLQQKLKAIQDETQYLRLRIQSSEKSLNDYKQEMVKVEKLMDARVDADLILEQARAEAERIRTQAQKENESLAQEVNFLQLQKTKVAAHLREYLKSQIALLEIVGDQKAEAAAKTIPVPEKVEPRVEKPVEIKETELPPPIIPVATEEELKAGLEEGIGSFVQDLKLDDLPPELAAAIRESADDTAITDPERHEKKKKVIEELEKLTHNATGIFKKSDFEKMLGDSADKKSHELLDQIHKELEKKRSEKS